MTTTAKPTIPVPTAHPVPPDPLLDVCVALTPGVGMVIQADGYAGHVPLLDITTGRAHLVISFAAAEAEA
jgi:hypothetical protein